MIRNLMERLDALEAAISQEDKIRVIMDNGKRSDNKGLAIIAPDDYSGSWVEIKEVDLGVL